MSLQKLIPARLRIEASWSKRRNRLENTSTKPGGGLQHAAQDNKAKQGLGLHSPTPHTSATPQTTLLTARTEPPSPSPGASYSNRRGEPRTAGAEAASSSIQGEVERACAGDDGRLQTGESDISPEDVSKRSR
ncbi:hypothetical protein Q8A73_020746 [Channa argus]|nr:hypothetical protein Q8A73_020746 [Channa argus]